MKNHLKQSLQRFFAFLFVFALLLIAHVYAREDEVAVDGSVDSRASLASVDVFHLRLFEKCRELSMMAKYTGGLIHDQMQGLVREYQSGMWEVRKILSIEGAAPPELSYDFVIYIKLVDDNEPSISIRVKKVELHFRVVDSEGKNAEKKLVPDTKITFESLIRSLDDKDPHIWRLGGK